MDGEHCDCLERLEAMLTRDNTLQRVVRWHPGHGEPDKFGVELVRDNDESMCGTGSTLAAAIDDIERKIGETEGRVDG